MKKIFSFSLLLFAFLANGQKPTINHLAIYVQDLQKSTHFYKNIIGLDTIPEPFHDGRHTWFSMGNNTELHVVAGAKAPQIDEHNIHFALSVPSIEAFINRLSKEGISYGDFQQNPNAITTRPDGIKQIYFKDLDGYWIEVNDAANKK